MRGNCALLACLLVVCLLFACCLFVVDDGDCGASLIVLTYQKIFISNFFITYVQVPYYYVKDMSGVKVATNILTGLVRRRFPQLSSHLIALNFPLELFSIPWLCSLFSSSFPAETVYRIWDALFLNGADTLFYVTMAFLRVHQISLLSLTNMMDANEYIKQQSETCYDVETLMEVCWAFYSILIVVVVVVVVVVVPFLVATILMIFFFLLLLFFFSHFKNIFGISLLVHVYSWH